MSALQKCEWWRHTTVWSVGHSSGYGRKLILFLLYFEHYYVIKLREINARFNERTVKGMSNTPIYDTLACMQLIKKKYPLIPICIIRRVLFAEELYMHKIGIIDWVPKLDHWHFKKWGLKTWLKYTRSFLFYIFERRKVKTWKLWSRLTIG